MEFPDFSWATGNFDNRQLLHQYQNDRFRINTLWNLAWQYTARSTAQSSQTHSYEQNLMAPPKHSPSLKTPVCMECNENLGAGCMRPFCQYEHICYLCINVSGIPEKCHKAIYCQNKEQRLYSSPASLNHQNKSLSKTKTRFTVCLLLILF